MKRLAALLLAAVCVFCLAGCGNKFLGKWETVSYEFDGVIITENDKSDLRAMIQLSLEKDGSGTARINGEECELEWVKNSTRYDLTVTYGDSKLSGSIDSEGRIMELTVVSGTSMGVKLRLEKVESFYGE